MCNECACIIADHEFHKLLLHVLEVNTYTAIQPLLNEIKVK